MEEKQLLLYVDTNIYLDMIEQRSDKLRPLGDFAFNFFADGWNCKFKLVISQHLIDELKRNVSDKRKYEEIFDIFDKKKKLIFVKEEVEDRKTAKKHKEENDALHAILAKRAGVTYLVTRNSEDYSDCQSIVTVVLPEYV